tara:strand:- start:248 stop:547 length:300 start_codon:yes stop_codon:yes gene_type:complete
MPIYIKKETIKKTFLKDKVNIRRKIVNEHKIWIYSLKAKGLNIKSGFLINKNKEPGGGGILIVECDSYKTALDIVSQDPLVKNKIVDWDLYEWIDISNY